ALERGIEIAERNGLDLETADLFITKSWAVDTLGRPREAVALGQAGMDLADRLDYMPGRIRSRMNVSNILVVTEPARALAVSRAGMDLALRIGHADWAASLAGNAGTASLLTGDWDETIRIATELDHERLSPFSRASLTGAALIIRAFRGELDETALDTDLLKTLATSDSAQDRGIRHALRAFMMVGLGKPRDAVKATRQAVSELPEGSETLTALAYMGRAGIQLRDETVIAEAVDLMLRISPGSGWIRVCVGELRAGGLALAGDRTGAAREFLEAIERYRALGLPPEVAVATIEALELVSDALGERDAMIAEVSAIIDQLRFETLRPRLEAIPARTPEAVATLDRTIPHPGALGPMQAR
ncbi:MAG: hypothetical protein M3404_09570, partial [Actinomycetota bacterium]|nr:hypothetical protein [Actinomycetota bacterium]